MAQLGEHKQFLEESLAVLLQEKEAILNTHKTSTTRVTSLEDEVSSLKQQVCKLISPYFRQEPVLEIMWRVAIC